MGPGEAGSQARLGHQVTSSSTGCPGLNPCYKCLCVPPRAPGGHTLPLICHMSLSPVARGTLVGVAEPAGVLRIQVPPSQDGPQLSLQDRVGIRVQMS